MTLEELLNKCIQRGWKPFGNKKIRDAKTARWNINLLDEKLNNVSKFKDKVAFTNGVLIFDEINMRELVSKESGLWQFVCENGYNLYKKNYFHWFSKYGLKGEYWDTSDFEYYVLESALCDEDKLEQFLLDNIKIDE